MESHFYLGKVWHHRETPVSHGFSYPVFALAVDLDELEELDRSIWGFGYNRFNLLSLYDRDYLPGPGTIREKYFTLTGKHEEAQAVEKIVLVTTPRYFNYVFNPVSFYYGLDGQGRLRCVVAEVHNTFSECHVYVLGRSGNNLTWPATFRNAKEFYVSPFNDMRGEYAFRLGPLSAALDIRVDLWRNGNVVLKASWSGQALPMERNALCHLLARRPLAAIMAMPRITYEAIRLYYGKKLALTSRPYATHAHTLIRREATRLEKAGLRAMDRLFSHIERGRLRVVLPEGETRIYGPTDYDSGKEKPPCMRIVSHAFFRALLSHGDVGIGEAWTDESWTSDDLPGVMRVLADNLIAFEKVLAGMGWLRQVGRRLAHALRDNTRKGSRRNISAHYDFGNAFFALFLDPRMMYSCAYYKDTNTNLDQAQVNKIAMILRKADIRPEHHVLEIGSGWGGFAIMAARQTGCRITSITLSRCQCEFAAEQARQAGLADQVTFEVRDYRDLHDAYDRIVSIEMLEAVGHRHQNAFFRCCDKALAPGGRAVIQVITIPDQRYEAYRQSPDWTQIYIFPGGMLPSLTVMTQAMTRGSSLIVDDVENIGPHYATTLRTWRERFEQNHDQLLDMGYPERVQRMWRYYFSYCEAGFATHMLNDLQLVLKRAGDQ